MTPRERHLKRLYGLTLDQYNEILEKQGGCCAICKRPATAFKTNLSVDHNHSTGEVRGVACTYCNRYVIGRHKDPDLLRRLADYVSQGTGLFVPEKFKTGVKKTRKRKKRNV